MKYFLPLTAAGCDLFAQKLYSKKCSILFTVSKTYDLYEILCGSNVDLQHACYLDSNDFQHGEVYVRL